MLTNGFIKKEQEAQAEGEKTVTVTKAEFANYAPRNYFGAMVRGVDEATVLTELSGTVREVFIKEGATVKKGQLLAIISVPDLSLKVKQSEVGAKIVEEQEKNARRYWDDYDPEAKKQFKLQSEKARLGANEAQAIFAKTQIRAPYAGVVSGKFIETGDTVFPGTKAFDLVTTNDWLEVKVDVPMNVGKLIKIGDEVVVRNSAGKEMKAIVKEISPKADSQTRKMSARVTFEKSSGFELGEFVEVGFKMPSINDVVKLPQNAVVKIYNDNFVFAVNDAGVVEMKKIQVLGESEGKIVTKGVSSNEEIIVSGAHDVSDGEKVNVVEESK